MSDSASLGQANFRYVQTDATGYSQIFQLGTLGGVGKRSLVADAKEALVRSIGGLESNQTLANVTVNFKTSNYAVVTVTKCLVTADVVEFR